MRNVIKEFLDYCAVERRLAKNTVLAYDADLRHFRRFQCTNRRRDTTTQDVRDYLHFMLVENELSLSTVRRRVACLQSFFGFAAERHDWDSPFASWSPELKRPKRLPRALSVSEVVSLVSAKKAQVLDRDTVFAVLLISATGVRVSELCAIKVIDISPDGTAIRITGKGSRDRVVFVSDKGLQRELLVRRKSRQVDQGEAAFLLLNSRGTPLKPQTLRRRLHKFRQSSSLERVVTPHMLRHTAATLLIEKGTDIRFVQRLLGHASISTTEIYTHVTDTSLRKAIEKADALADIVPSSV